MTPSLAGAPEAGWVLSPWSHGRGYAMEALTAATAWLDAHHDRPRTVCIIAPDNAPSIRVAQKVGYREWTRGVLKGQPTLLFERVSA